MCFCAPSLLPGPCLARSDSGFPQVQRVSVDVQMRTGCRGRRVRFSKGRQPCSQDCVRLEIAKSRDLQCVTEPKIDLDATSTVDGVVSAFVVQAFLGRSILTEDDGSQRTILCTLFRGKQGGQGRERGGNFGARKRRSGSGGGFMLGMRLSMCWIE